MFFEFKALGSGFVEGLVGKEDIEKRSKLPSRVLGFKDSKKISKPQCHGKLYSGYYMDPFLHLYLKPPNVALFWGWGPGLGYVFLSLRLAGELCWKDNAPLCRVCLGSYS